jgi:hypothetical protein
MRSRMQLRLAPMACLAALAMLLAACTKAPAETRLRERIDAMQEAIATRNVSQFMEGVAEDFIGSGNIDRAALHNLIRAQVLRNASITATRGPTTVTLQGERAVVNFDVVVTGGAGGLIPERAQSYAIESGWREIDGEWVVYSAQWKEAL